MHSFSYLYHSLALADTRWYMCNINKKQEIQNNRNKPSIKSFINVISWLFSSHLQSYQSRILICTRPSIHFFKSICSSLYQVSFFLQTVVYKMNNFEIEKLQTISSNVTVCICGSEISYTSTFPYFSWWYVHARFLRLYWNKHVFQFLRYFKILKDL